MDNEDNCFFGCIPRCCMILRETDSVRISSCSDKEVVHGPSLCVCRSCFNDWERFSKIELFINEFTLVENVLDPTKNRYVNKKTKKRILHFKFLFD